MPPNPQPILPAEGTYSDLEHLFIEEQPKNLWPTNQNSNLGAIRKVLSDLLQGGLTTLDELAQERFVTSSKATGYLGRWESEVGLPVAPGSVSEASRRALVLGRLQKGAYTRQRRNEIVEAHITATFGQPLELTPAGVPIPVEGIPLFSEAGIVTELYRIYEDTKNFSFEIRLDQDVDPNFLSLDREIRFATPAWLSFSIAEYANILDYAKWKAHLAPVAWWRLGTNFNDSSGYGNNATAVGGVTAGSVVSPGLLTTGVGGADAATDFDGTDDHLTVPANSTITMVGPLTLQAVVRPDVLPSGTGGNQYAMILADQGSVNYLCLAAPGIPVMSLMIDGVQRTVSGSSALTAGQIRYLEGVWDGSYMRLFLQGVQVGQSGPWSGNVTMTGSWFIGQYGGATYRFNGALDELAIYNYPLSDAQILENFKTGTNVP